MKNIKDACLMLYSKTLPLMQDIIQKVINFIDIIYSKSFPFFIIVQVWIRT